MSDRVPSDCIDSMSKNSNNCTNGQHNDSAASSKTCSSSSASNYNSSNCPSNWSAMKPLPKLPVPDLRSTMTKYLSLVKTVVSPSDYVRTKYLVDEFCKDSGDGPKLQEYLVKKREEEDNWSYDYWLKDMYLNIKLPLPINSNPGAMFPYQMFQSTHDQLRYAARFVRGVFDFKKKAEERDIPVERCSYREKGQPMCMEQHFRLLTSYRFPGKTADWQATDIKDNDNIVVAFKNQFYKIEATQDGELLSEAAWIQQLAKVQKMTNSLQNPYPALGLMTSLPRDVWAEHRDELRLDDTNQNSLEVLKKCALLVCLDQDTKLADEGPRSGLLEDSTTRAHHVLHGQGVDVNSGNRWMDKTVQVIVSEDGTCGANIEHSVAEGIALGTMLEHAFAYMDKQETPIKAEDLRQLPTPQPLTWNFSADFGDSIHRAADSVQKLVDDFDLRVIEFHGYGRNFIKAQKMSPDAFIQLSLQLTYYKIHGSLCSTYESASVRRFRQGRVDVIRANSPAALTWIKAMLGETDSTEQSRKSLLMEAIRWQQDYTADTIQGHGIDLHLLGLREAAVDLGLPTPALFQDSSYVTSNTFKLSTSQVSTASDYFMGYGAVVPDGYGCCYNPRGESILFSVGTFRSAPDTSSDMFVQSLESSLLQMAEVCRAEVSECRD